MPSPSAELLRIDPLTGCQNFLGFLEASLQHSASDGPQDLRKIIDSSVKTLSQYSAVLFVEMNHVKYLNETKGRAHGDSAIRWMGILLQEECPNHIVHRLGGVEFAVLLTLVAPDAHAQMIAHILERINREASLLGFPHSPANLALILFD